MRTRQRRQKGGGQGAGWRRRHIRCGSQIGEQIGYFSPSFLPGKGKARQTEFLATKAQAQNQCMEQQGEQQR
ncbi:MAG: hypothetical protein CVU34_13880 [Betaproteobacteria bacterium HGW-Betaproteobacteria-7]|nr:MAG: hypothetical protein CVU34_13880 [Betaproteobacteria bacterium HGW-Betaproteobacteria-7]